MARDFNTIDWARQVFATWIAKFEHLDFKPDIPSEEGMEISCLLKTYEI